MASVQVIWNWCGWLYTAGTLEPCAFLMIPCGTWMHGQVINFWQEKELKALWNSTCFLFWALFNGKPSLLSYQKFDFTITLYILKMTLCHRQGFELRKYRPLSQHKFCANNDFVAKPTMIVWQCGSRALKLRQLNEIQPSFILSMTPVFVKCLQWKRHTERWTNTF